MFFSYLCPQQFTDDHQLSISGAGAGNFCAEITPFQIAWYYLLVNG